jgi:DUF438 domain-containing protein
MYSLDELRKQNQDISQLCDVLSVLMEQRSLHDNPYVCELLSRFKEKVWIHLVFEDNTIYAELARHGDPAVSEVAQGFHDSAKEIKKRFSAYVRHWCKPAIDEAEHRALANESREIFRLIRERIAYENEHMFPLVAEH